MTMEAMTLKTVSYLKAQTASQYWYYIIMNSNVNLLQLLTSINKISKILYPLDQAMRGFCIFIDFGNMDHRLNLNTL